MDNYTENRFGYFKQMSDEDILKVRDELEREISEYEDELLDDSLRSDEKSEIRNSDLPYAREQLDYVNGVIDSRGLLMRK